MPTEALASHGWWRDYENLSRALVLDHPPLPLQPQPPLFMVSLFLSLSPSPRPLLLRIERVLMDQISSRTFVPTLRWRRCGRLWPAKRVHARARRRTKDNATRVELPGLGHSHSPILSSTASKGDKNSFERRNAPATRGAPCLNCGCQLPGLLPAACGLLRQRRDRRMCCTTPREALPRARPRHPLPPSHPRAAGTRGPETRLAKGRGGAQPRGRAWTRAGLSATRLDTVQSNSTSVGVE